MEYILDSNFFIEAHRKTYPLDVATGFWQSVKSLAEQGVIVSIDKVRNELYDKNDELENWCRTNLPDHFFKDSSTVLTQYTSVVNWAPNRQPPYLPTAFSDFMHADRADAFLVAYALADSSNRTVVTQEVGHPNKTTIVKIPDCCTAFGVRYLDTIGMFRALGATF